jgi:tetratricopeptide (TPR) repeat protein
MMSPGFGAGMGRNASGLGARSGMNMAGRSFAPSSMGRSGVNGSGRAAVGSGRFGSMGNPYGVGTRAPVNTAARLGGTGAFGTRAGSGRLGTGLTATSLNRSNFANNRSLNINRTSNNFNVNSVRTGGYYGGYGYGGYGRYGRGYGFGYPGYGYGLGYGGFGLGYGLGGFGLGFGLGSLFGLGYGGYGWGGYGGWGGGGYGGWGGYGGYGGYGYGYSPGLYGSSLYDWGYSNYDNPYYSGYGYPVAGSLLTQPTVFDYSQPISTTAAAPAPTVADEVGTSFDSARDAFKSGDYAKALELTDQSIRQMPNDAALHEFRGVVLFALHRYDDAAVALYAVLAVGPGWDWPTLVGLYANVAIYTEQLRSLESYCQLNPGSASARFVLAYFYLTQGHTDAALGQLKRVLALQPKDTVAAQLIKRLDPSAASGGAASSQPSTPPPGPALVPGTATAPAGSVKQGRLEGSWTAQPDPDTTITLSLRDAGQFTWKVAHKGQDRVIQGKETSGNGLLTLVQEQGTPIVGNIVWVDETHFTFRIAGGGPEDPGLSFTKTP